MSKRLNETRTSSKLIGIGCLGEVVIEEILKNAGFEFFSKTLSPISGLIYAYKK